MAEQEDVTELETLRMKERLLVNPNDPEAQAFFAVLKEWKLGLAAGDSKAARSLRTTPR